MEKTNKDNFTIFALLTLYSTFSNGVNSYDNQRETTRSSNDRYFIKHLRILRNGSYANVPAIHAKIQKVSSRGPAL